MARAACSSTAARLHTSPTSGNTPHHLRGGFGFADPASMAFANNATPVHDSRCMEASSTTISSHSTTPRGSSVLPRILGVDPGLQCTGFALIESLNPIRGESRLVEAGVVRLPPRVALEKRLLVLDEELDQILGMHRPAALVCEQLYAHYKHPRTAILMGHARGVILALAARRGVRVLSVASTHVKRMLTGNGHAGKPQMQRAVAASLRLARLPEPHDVADAIAIALCGQRMIEAGEAQ